MTSYSWKYPTKGICSGLDVVEKIKFARIATLDDGGTLMRIAIHVPGDGNEDQPREYWTQEKLDEVAASISDGLDQAMRDHVSRMGT